MSQARETQVLAGGGEVGRGRGASRGLVCRVSTGGSKGQQIAIGSRPILVGADPSCDLVVDDPKVSRRHVELVLSAEGIRVRDAGSRNGTFVDGVRLSEAVLPLGASVRIGGTTLRFLEAPQPALQPSGRNRFGGLVGESVAMREVFAVLELAAPSDATVLILGESGTGKELAARAVHDHSPRSTGPFVVIDCSATSEQLIESQLFGHRRGAFTGAVGDREGAFVSAKGGTVFLDEIGELPLASQARLLRVLESKTIQPVGTDRQIPVDVRIVAATHRDLASMVEQKTFRFDLLHRLSVLSTHLPPLRERLEDLPCLIAAFYEGRGSDPGEIAGQNLERLGAHPWPGNVRELRNVLERAWVLSGPNRHRFQELSLWLEASELATGEVVDISLPFKEAKERWVDSFERRYLAAVFAKFGQNITRASEHAQINRRHFRELLEQHGLREPNSSE